MRHLIGFFIVLAANLAVFSQQPVPTPILYSDQTLSEMKALQKAALSDDYSFRQTAYLTNNIGPRLSGSAQAQRAVEYIAEEMRKQGFVVTLQELMVPHWVRGAESGALIEFPGMAPATEQKVVLTALGGSVATGDSGLTADVVVVDSFDELAKLGRSAVENKIVLFNYRFDRKLAECGNGSIAYGQAVQYRGAGPSAAARLGAVAALVRSAGGSQNRLAHTGGTRYDENAPKIPAAAVSSEDADLIEYLAKMGKVRMRLKLTPKTLPDAKSYNVIADLPGSERPNEFVIVSGHLDSWDLGTGALDDATGIAASMQVLNLVQKLGLKPKRTIRFIAYMNEENGLVGGTKYAESQAANIGRHFAAIESDLGASRTIGMLFAGKPEALPYLAPISSVLGGQGAAAVQRQPGVGADIGPLTQRGVPSFAPWFDTRTYFNYHHTAADTLDKVDPEDLKRLSAFMSVLAYGLANLEQPLPR
ncbi:MAG: M20/M25/M40 family metallo-hydrolase [Pyrinomonadaceae bacterium]